MVSELNRFILLNPPGVLEVILLTAVLLLVIYGGLRGTRHITDLRRKAVLLGLHLLAFLCLALLIFNPALRVESYLEQKRKIAVLIDNSWSMNLPADKEGVSRIDSVKKYLRDNQEFISRIEDKFEVEYFTFDTGLEPASVDTILGLSPSGKHTDFLHVLKSLNEMTEKENIDSLILFSDGAGNREFDAESYEDPGFSINTVTPLTEDKVTDIWIDAINSSEVTFLRYPYEIEIVVKSEGIEGINIPVTLYEEDRLVSIKEVFIEPDTKKGKVSFEVTPTSLGRKLYTASVPEISNELVHENNKKTFYTDVVINKIRVLHVAGSPSWDVKYFRKALKRNPNLDLVSFFILRDPTDLAFASDNELSLIPFPVNEIFGSELRTFDIVIFQNFNFQPYGIFGFHLRNIRDYIMNDGGAFLMIGGNNSFESGNYGRTPISEILPVELDYLPRTLSEPQRDQRFRAVLTNAAKTHPIMSILPDIEKNENKWNELPELDGFNSVEGITPGATALLTTNEGEPIFAIGKVESGKVATFLSDSSWKWSFLLGSEGDVSPLYDKFWNRLFLWFINDPALQNINISTNKPIYNPGDTAKIDIRISTSGQYQSGSEATLTGPKGKRTNVPFERKSDNKYEGRFVPSEEGIYKLTADSLAPSVAETDWDMAEIAFAVAPPASELRGPTENSNLLRALSEKTGGRFITTQQSPLGLKLEGTKKKTITGYETVLLWDNPLFFAVILGLFSAEWLLRRRWGLK